MTKDPARADGEESAYQYCGGDPVGKVDPSGQVPEWVSTLGAWAKETVRALQFKRFPNPASAAHFFVWAAWASRFNLDWQLKAAGQYMTKTIKHPTRNAVGDINDAFIRWGWEECIGETTTHQWSHYPWRERCRAIVKTSRDFQSMKLRLIRDLAANS